jgi:hypothetical protein
LRDRKCPLRVLSMSAPYGRIYNCAVHFDDFGSI